MTNSDFERHFRNHCHHFLIYKSVSYFVEDKERKEKFIDNNGNTNIQLGKNLADDESS